MKIVIACRKCGYERLVTRESIVRGDWKKQRCPVCKAPDTDSERVPDAPDAA